MKNEVFYNNFTEMTGIEETSSVEQRIQAAKQRARLRMQGENSSDTARPTTVSELEVGPGEGRTTREIELIWWPNLYTSVDYGKLTVRFHIHKVTVAKM